MSSQSVNEIVVIYSLLLSLLLNLDIESVNLKGKNEEEY